MTWKKNANGRYEHACRNCGGTGKVEIGYGLSCCFGDDMELVEHPANGGDGFIGRRLERCNICGGVWLVHFEQSDDSWDVPSPVFVGHRIPDDDWRPSKP